MYPLINANGELFDMQFVALRPTHSETTVLPVYAHSPVATSRSCSSLAADSPPQ